MSKQSSHNNLDSIALLISIVALHGVVMVFLNLYLHIFKVVMSLSLIDSVASIFLGLRSNSTLGHLSVVIGIVVGLISLAFLFFL